MNDRASSSFGRADLVLLDPETVADNATFTEPLKLSTGIDRVWVAGTPVWAGGKATGARPGRVLAARHR